MLRNVNVPINIIAIDNIIFDFLANWSFFITIIKNIHVIIIIAKSLNFKSIPAFGKGFIDFVLSSHDVLFFFEISIFELLLVSLMILSNELLSLLTELFFSFRFFFSIFMFSLTILSICFSSDFFHIYSPYFSFHSFNFSSNN